MRVQARKTSHLRTSCVKQELSCGQRRPVNHSLCSHSVPIWWLQLGPAEASTRLGQPLAGKQAACSSNWSKGVNSDCSWRGRDGDSFKEGRQGVVTLWLELWSQRNLWGDEIAWCGFHWDATAEWRCRGERSDWEPGTKQRHKPGKVSLATISYYGMNPFHTVHWVKSALCEYVRLKRSLI